MNSHASKSRKPSLDELVFNALRQLQVLPVQPAFDRRYQSVWRRLVVFAHQQGHEGRLREQLILDFLEHHQINSRVPIRALKGWKTCWYGLTLLWQFACFGYFRAWQTHAGKLCIPATMQRSQHDFKKNIARRNVTSPHTVNEYVRQVGLFLDFL